MKTIIEVLQLSTKYLANLGVEDAKRDVELLFSALLGIERYQLYMEYDRPLKEEELQLFRGGLMRLVNHEPWQYIAGMVQFYGCKIKVSPDVLIPRQETEILVDEVCKKIKKDGAEGKKLLDLCSGSGCIGIALKKTFPELSVYSSDISEQALALSRVNANLNEVDIHFRVSDLLSAFVNEKFDYIVCNPPYVSVDEYQLLHSKVKNFEPKGALVAGPEGLDIYLRLSENIDEYLLAKGSLWFEIGASQGKKVKEIFQKPCWVKKEVSLDWAGHARFFFLEIE